MVKVSTVHGIFVTSPSRTRILFCIMVVWSFGNCGLPICLCFLRFVGCRFRVLKRIEIAARSLCRYCRGLGRFRKGINVTESINFRNSENQASRYCEAMMGRKKFHFGSEISKSAFIYLRIRKTQYISM